MSDTEMRDCNECGEQWIDNGDPHCPYCGSENIAPVEDSDD